MRTNQVGVWIVTGMLALLAQPALAAPRGPSTAEERAKAMQLVEVLETRPWSDEAKAGREWLTAFFDAVPDITVKKCFSLLGAPQERQGIADFLLLQPMFSSAAYQLQHPTVGAGSTEAFTAGLRGTLRAYAALKAHKAAETIGRLEDLQKLANDGHLENYARAQGRFCL